MATLIEMVILLILSGLIILMINKADASDKFEKKYLAQDISMFIDAIYSSPNELIVRYPEDTIGYAFKFDETKTKVFKESEINSETFMFSSQRDIGLVKKVLYPNIDIVDDKETKSIPLMFVLTKKSLTPTSGLLQKTVSLEKAAPAQKEETNDLTLDEKYKENENGCSNFPRLECKPTGFKQSRNGISPDCVVLHYSVSGSPEATDNYLRTKKISVHYILGRECKIIQQVPDNEIAWHAGCYQSKADCPLDKDTNEKTDCEVCLPSCPVCEYNNRFINPNSRCIGIEIDNFGFECERFGGKECTQELTNKYSNEIGKWEIYPDEQLNCLADLVCNIVKKNSIPITRQNILGHDEITAGKSDPGPAFDWDKFMALLKARCKSE
jgi:N-acetyl-anhydromuramyl-L-alanine amidase AmpD